MRSERCGRSSASMNRTTTATARIATTFGPARRLVFRSRTMTRTTNDTLSRGVLSQSNGGEMNAAQARVNALQAIEYERQSQEEQWGGPSHDDKHTGSSWALLLTKHVGRLAGDMIEDGED